MRRVSALLALFGLVFAMLPASALAAPRAPGSEAVIVVFNDSVADPAAAASELGRQHAFGLDYVYRHALRGFAASVPAGAVEALARDPRVAWVEPDQAVHLYDEPQTIPTGVARIFADDNANIDIDSTDDLRIDVDIAIIDTGIDLDHPDLNVVESTSCLYRSGRGPFATYSCGDGGDDDNDHGTHVAGSAAALDNGIGVVGVAPGARLWAVKVLDANGSGSLSAVTAGIDYVTANAGKIEVANMSLGCECTSAAMNTAIANSVDAGVTYAVAAGNSDKDASTFSPANHPDVITVSALADFDGEPGAIATEPFCRPDQDDTLADFSNWGPMIEIAAPGVCIYSTVPGGYARFSGTSMASPHVAGAAALLAASGDYEPDGIRATLIAEGNSNWTDDSGDVLPHEPLLDVSNEDVFKPKTVAPDSGGGGGGEETTFSLALIGSSAPQGNNNWILRVTIAASDASGVAVTGVAVTGGWSNGGTATCTTGDAGTCLVSRSQHKRVGSVTFTVTSASHSSGSPTWDDGPDFVTVTKP